MSVIFRRHVKLLTAVFFFSLCLFLLCSSGHFYVRDEATRARVTASIVERGGISIEAGDGDIGRGGRLYGKYGIAQSLLAVPLFAAGSAAGRLAGDSLSFLPFVLTSLLNSIVTAACVTLFILALLRAGVDVCFVVPASFIYGVCSLAFPYAKTFFTEPLVAFWFLLAFHYQPRDEDDAARNAVLSGVFLGLAALTRHEVIVLSAAWFAATFIFSAKGRWRLLALQMLPVFLCGCCQLFFNWYRFGSISNFGYRTETFSTSMATGLYGLLFSTGKGIFLFCPVVLIGLAGMRAFARRDRRAAFICAAAPVLALLMYSKWNLWGGDLSWGPRYLVAVLPFILLPCAETISAIWSSNSNSMSIKTRKAAVIVLAALSFAVQALAVTVDFHIYTDVMATAMYQPEDEAFKDMEMMDRIYFQPKYSPILADIEFIRVMLAGDAESKFLNPLGKPGVQDMISRTARPDFLIARYAGKFRGQPAKLAALGLFAIVNIIGVLISLITIFKYTNNKH